MSVTVTLAGVCSIYFHVLKSDKFEAEYEVASKPEGKYKVFLFGKGKWTSLIPHTYFSERHGSVFNCYRENCRHWILVECLYVILTSISSGWRPAYSDGCMVRSLIIFVILLLYTAALLVRRPYLAVCDNVVWTLFAMGQSVAVLLTVLSYRSVENTELTMVSGMILTIITGIALFKAVVDTVFTAYESHVSVTKSGDAHERELMSNASGDNVELKTNFSTVPPDTPVLSPPLAFLDTTTGPSQSLTPSSSFLVPHAGSADLRGGRRLSGTLGAPKRPQQRSAVPSRTNSVVSDILELSKSPSIPLLRSPSVEMRRTSQVFRI